MLRSGAVRQATLYAVSNAAMGVLVAASMALVARNVSEDAFGSYAFAISYFLLSGLFFEFGLFVPASRLAARAEKPERSRIVGAAFIAFIPVGVAYCLFTFAVSYGVDDVFNVHAGEALRVSAPLAFVYAFRLIGLQLAQGLGRLHAFSITNVAGQAVFIAALVGAISLTGDTGVEMALLLRSAGIGLGWVALAIWLRPAFAGSVRLIRTLVLEAREWGLQVYVGRILSLGTYNMDVMMVGAFTNSREVGLYALAGGLATAIGFPVIGLANALFPRMVRTNHLDSRWLVAAYVLGGIGALAVVLIAAPAIGLLFSDRYLDAQSFLVPLALAQAVRGVTWVYHQFLSAQASGRDLRNAALILTGSNLVLNFALIPPFGGLGAAWASLIALLANLAAHIVFYRRRVRELGVAEPMSQAIPTSPVESG